MPNKDEEDPAKIFLEAMHDVKPLKQIKQKNYSKNTSHKITQKINYITRRAAAENKEDTLILKLSDTRIEPVEPEQILTFSRPGIQQSRLKKLRNGLIKTQHQLDLHRHSIEEAQQSTIKFLDFCQNNSFRCVSIIHGKAHSNHDRQTTLKSHINHWLKQFPQVIAFCSAPHNKGGAGSLLLLLKKQRNNV